MLWLLAANLAQAAESGALLTIVEGPATVIDGARSLTAVPGLKLGAATLIDTTPATNLLRVEFADGSTLDIGPDSHVMLMPPGLAGSGPKAPAFYLLQGWAKHSTAGRADGATGAGQLAPQLELLQVAGVMVGRVSADEAMLFVESGRAQLLERKLKGSATLGLKAGELYSRSGSDKGTVVPRPTAAFLQGLPRSFRDTLPPLAAKFKGKPVEPKATPAPAYAALKPWLSAEPVIRREFPRRFGALAKDPAFREALVKNLSSHPEWEPVLFPPKPASNAFR
ncbi:hypothetical protein [Aquabacterium sp.]|uniref:hypothetical protein n=1 Tax=Aquabacterium sp. TaxID=1872578 RepID=UPI002C4EF4EE|nr:hypothetical protein [Aquabacterium sp.]HSW03156.1 hypothetical protein [Aquabacterium sp.]